MPIHRKKGCHQGASESTDDLPLLFLMHPTQVDILYSFIIWLLFCACDWGQRKLRLTWLVLYMCLPTGNPLQLSIDSHNKEHSILSPSPDILYKQVCSWNSKWEKQMASSFPGCTWVRNRRLGSSEIFCSADTREAAGLAQICPISWPQAARFCYRHSFRSQMANKPYKILWWEVYSETINTERFYSSCLPRLSKGSASIIILGFQGLPPCYGWGACGTEGKGPSALWKHGGKKRTLHITAVSCYSVLQS